MVGWLGWLVGLAGLAELAGLLGLAGSLARFLKHLPSLNVFGRAAWTKFEELQQNDVIVVVGNGPVCSHDHGEYIEKAKMVICCNHY